MPSSSLADQYWAWRMSYPTGEFQGRWLADQAQSETQIKRALPLGSNARLKSGDVGMLDPNRATELGPKPLNWDDPSQPYGRVAGRVNVLLTHPSDARVAWLGSDGGGVWKTSNCCGADTAWASKTDSPALANIAIGALALDPQNPDVVYAGTGDFRRNRPFSFGAGGLLRSSDGGESWSLLGAEVFNPAYSQSSGEFPQYRAISAVAVDPNGSHRLVVGTNQGLYLSANSGQNWTGPCFSNTFSSQRQDITGLALIDQGASTRLLVAVGAIGQNSEVRSDLARNGANGVYAVQLPTTATCPSAWSLLSRSNNGWPAGSGSGVPTGQSGGNPLKRLDLAVAPSNDQILYVQAQNLGVWRSDNGGSSWSQVATQPADFASGCVHDSFGNGMLFQDYNAGLIVSPTDPNTLFLSATDIWRSTNGGDSFRNLSCGYDEIAPGVPGSVHVDNHARAIVGNDPQRLLIGNDGGVNYSGNALDAQPSFIGLNSQLPTIEFYSGSISAGFNDPQVAERYIGGGAQDNGGSNTRWTAGQRPSAIEWTLRSGGDGIGVHFDPILGQRWYYSSQFLHIFASTTGYAGPAAQEISASAWGNDRRGFLAPFELYSLGDEATCPAASGCQRMLAGTYRVWEHLSGGIPQSGWYPNSPDLTKRLSTSGNLSIINSIKHLPADPTRAIVATNDGNVWVGTGLGQGSADSASWRNLTGNNTQLPNRPIMDISPHPHDSRSALVGLAGFDQNTPSTPGHVYRLSCSVADCSSFDWRNLSGNLPNIPVNAVLINPNRPRQAFAGTDWGLYFTEDVEASSVQWQRYAGGLPSAMIWDLVVDRGATTLAIFTRSRGAWVVPLAQADVEVLTIAVHSVAELRAAMETANANPSARYELRLHGQGYALDAALPLLSGKVSLNASQSGGLRPTVIGAHRLIEVVQGGELSILGGTVSGFGSAGNGGCVLLSAGGSLSVSGSVQFSNCRSAGDGGAIFSQGELRIEEASFEDNVAERGGAVAHSGAAIAKLSMVVFNTNQASVGGAVFANGPAQIRRSVFAGNRSQGTGGALSLHEAQIEVVLSRFEDNIADQGACDIAFDDATAAGQLSIQNNQFAGAGCAGSRVHNGSGRLNVLANSGFASGGSAVLSSGGELNLLGSLLGALPASAAKRSKAACGAGAVRSIGGNLSDDSTCALGQPSDLQGAQLGLAAPDGNRIYGLLAASPAVDRGSASLLNLPAAGAMRSQLPCGYRDLRGLGRPQDGNGDGVFECDSGAWELQGGADIGAAQSGIYFDPARSGEGHFVELIGAGRAVVSTFSYGENGGMAWFIGSGEVVGNSVVVDEYLSTSGGAFGAAFLPDKVVRRRAAGISLVFPSCESEQQPGRFVFDADNSGDQDLIAVAYRLAAVLPCSGQPHPLAYRSGAYYPIDRSGEGIFIQYLPDGRVVLAFYGYTPDGEQFWAFSGEVSVSGDTVTAQMLYPARGTRFGSNFNPSEVDLQPWGVITLVQTDCNNLDLRYDSVLPAYGSGRYPYVRLTQLEGTQCPAP